MRRRKERDAGRDRGKSYNLHTDGGEKGEAKILLFTISVFPNFSHLEVVTRHFKQTNLILHRKLHPASHSEVCTHGIYVKNAKLFFLNQKPDIRFFLHIWATVLRDTVSVRKPRHFCSCFMKW